MTMNYPPLGEFESEQERRKRGADVFKRYFDGWAKDRRRRVDDEERQNRENAAQFAAYVNDFYGGPGNTSAPTRDYNAEAEKFKAAVEPPQQRFRGLLAAQGMSEQEAAVQPGEAALGYAERMGQRGINIPQPYAQTGPPSLTKSLLPRGVLEQIERVPYAGGPLRRAAEGLTSPLGLATLPIGGVSGTAAKMLAGGLAGQVGAGTIAEAAGAPSGVQLGAELGGGILGGLGGLRGYAPDVGKDIVAHLPRLPKEPVGALLPTAITKETWRTIERTVTGPEKPDILRRGAELLSNVPGTKPIIRTTAGEAALARKDPLARVGTTYLRVADLQQTRLDQELSQFQAFRQEIKPGSRPGLSRFGGGPELPAGDVLENPDKWGGLSPTLRTELDNARTLIDRKAAEYEAVSGKSLFAKVGPKVERQHYWPRFTLNEKGEVFVRAPIGMKQSPAKDRLINAMADGIADGIPYADPMQTLELYARALDKMTRDELMRQVILEDGLGRVVRRAKYGEVLGMKLGPAFNKVAFSRENRQRLEDMVGPGKGFLRPLEMSQAVPRFLLTGMADVGHFSIQGATLLHNPAQWGEAVGRSALAIARPDSYRRFLQTPAARFAAHYGVDVAGSEITEAATTGLLRKLTPISPWARGFDAFLGSARIINFHALAKLEKGGDEALFALGRYVNTKLGTPMLGGLGLSQGQRQAERAIFMFSPRYTRSVLGMVGYAFGKGLPAKDAREALFTMLFGGAAAYVGIAKAIGLPNSEILERLKPTSGGRFLSIPIGGMEYGFGGAYRSFLAFGVALGIHDNWDFSSWEQALADNPISRFLRSRTAPVTGTLIDFLRGEDYIGRPVSLQSFTDDPDLALSYAESHLAPLNITGYLQSGENPIALAVETVGGRSSPMAPKEMKEAVEEGWRPGPLREALETIPGTEAQRKLNVIPEFTGVSVEQARELREFYKEVDEWRNEALDKGLKQPSEKGAIRILGEKKGWKQPQIDLALILQYGTATRAKRQNPEFVRFVLDHFDELEKTAPWAIDDYIRRLHFLRQEQKK